MQDGLVFFKGAKIPEFEASVLLELERLTNKHFKLVESICKWRGYKGEFYSKETEIGDICFTVKENRMSGITLDDCNLKNLPGSIGRLQFLEALDVQYNNLTSLPDWITNLTSLRTLILSFNEITEIPESISNLKNLENLFIKHNQLTSLPESICNLKSLERLNLIGNPIKNISESLNNLDCSIWK